MRGGCLDHRIGAEHHRDVLQEVRGTTPRPGSPGRETRQVRPVRHGHSDSAEERSGARRRSPARRRGQGRREAAYEIREHGPGVPGGRDCGRGAGCRHLCSASFEFGLPVVGARGHEARRGPGAADPEGGCPRRQDQRLAAADHHQPRAQGHAACETPLPATDPVSAHPPEARGRTKVSLRPGTRHGTRAGLQPGTRHGSRPGVGQAPQPLATHETRPGLRSGTRHAPRPGVGQAPQPLATDETRSGLRSGTRHESRPGFGQKARSWTTHETRSGLRLGTRHGSRPRPRRETRP